jgi:biotin synthase
MLIAPHLERILKSALDGIPPKREDCIDLLKLPSESLEAGMLMAVADQVSRRRFGNKAILLAQVGIESFPCPANCQFCVFGEGHTGVPTQRLALEEIVDRAVSLTAGHDLYALFLMTMHTFDVDWFAQVVQRVRAIIPTPTQIVANIGDFDFSQACQLKAAGVDGAYHVCRLGEGQDTKLDPTARRATVEAIKRAGMDWYYCCEPIGPEHTPEMLVEQMFLGVELGCFQHAAMRRVQMSGVPLSRHGQISERRLAQVVAVVALASLACPDTKNIAVHEPNLLGLVAGANVVYAESGANPRDKEIETEGKRGITVTQCRTMLAEAGFSALQMPGNVSLPLVVAL